MFVTKLGVKCSWFNRLYFRKDLGFTRQELRDLENSRKLLYTHVARALLDRTTPLNVFNQDFNQVLVVIKAVPRAEDTLVFKNKNVPIYATYPAAINLNLLREEFSKLDYQSSLQSLTHHLLELFQPLGAEKTVEGLSVAEHIKKVNKIRYRYYQPLIWTYEFHDIILVFSGDNPKKFGPKKILESLKNFIPKALLTLSLSTILVVLPFLVVLVLHFTCLVI